MSKALTSSRLEAFSDGVIAVIITIMVLELKVPAHNVSNIDGLRQTLPLVLVYLLSFTQTGIYWVNHHYLVDDVEYVTHGMLWANLALLFCLSLIPFATNWLAERGISTFSVRLYILTAALPSLAWMVLANIVFRTTGVPPAAGWHKQMTSCCLYLLALAVCGYSPLLSLSLVGVVSVLWFIPPGRIVEATRAARPAQDAPHSR